MTRPAALDALVLTFGRIALVGFWFVAVLLVYRGLGASPEGLAQAGFFAVSIALVKTAAGFISDPVDLAIMRQVPPLLARQPARAFEALRASFALRMAAAGAAAAAVAAAAPLASLVAPEWAGAAPYLRYAALAIIGDALIRAVLSTMQVEERFKTFVLLEGLVGILRFAAVVALWLLGAMQVDLVLACYAGASFAASALGYVLLPRGLTASLATRADDFAKLLHYLKWIVPAMLLAAVNERLDVFLVYSFAGAAAAGLYGAALTLALVPDILGGCLSTLIQPRIMRIHAAGEYGMRQRQFLAVSLPVCAIGYGLSLLLAEPVFALALGPRYVAAAPAFHWLLAGTLFWLAVTPLPMTLVAVAAPRRIVLVTLAQSVLVLLGGLLLVPRSGWIGMAQAIFAMRVAVALLLVAAARGIAAPSDVEIAPAAAAGSAS